MAGAWTFPCLSNLLSIFSNLSSTLKRSVFVAIIWSYSLKTPSQPTKRLNLNIQHYYDQSADYKLIKVSFSLRQNMGYIVTSLSETNSFISDLTSITPYLWGSMSPECPKTILFSICFDLSTLYWKIEPERVGTNYTTPFREISEQIRDIILL